MHYVIFVSFSVKHVSKYLLQGTRGFVTLSGPKFQDNGLLPYTKGTAVYPIKLRKVFRFLSESEQVFERKKILFLFLLVLYQKYVLQTGNWQIFTGKAFTF